MYHVYQWVFQVKKIFCVLFFSLGSVQLDFIIRILGISRLGSSCPVDWKQSSFVKSIHFILAQSGASVEVRPLSF